jgi:hypothetical protein
VPSVNVAGMLGVRGVSVVVSFAAVLESPHSPRWVLSVADRSTQSANLGPTTC